MTGGTSLRNGALLLLLAVAACGPSARPGQAAPLAARDARDVIQRAETEHWQVRLITERSDTLIGRVAVRGRQIRLIGTTVRLDVDDLAMIHRLSASRPTDERGEAFRIGGVVLGLALTAPLALVLLRLSAGEMVIPALGFLAAGAIGGGVLGAGAAEMDEAGSGDEWTLLWKAHED